MDTHGRKAYLSWIANNIIYIFLFWEVPLFVVAPKFLKCNMMAQLFYGSSFCMTYCMHQKSKEGGIVLKQSSGYFYAFWELCAVTFVLFTSKLLLNQSCDKHYILNHHLPFFSSEPHKSFTSLLLHGPNHFEVYYHCLLNWQWFAPPLCAIILFFITLLHIFFPDHWHKKWIKPASIVIFITFSKRATFIPQMQRNECQREGGLDPAMLKKIGSLETLGLNKNVW